MGVRTTVLLHHAAVNAAPHAIAAGNATVRTETGIGRGPVTEIGSAIVMHTIVIIVSARGIVLGPGSAIVEIITVVHTVGRRGPVSRQRRRPVAMRRHHQRQVASHAVQRVVQRVVALTMMSVIVRERAMCLQPLTEITARGTSAVKLVTLWDVRCRSLEIDRNVHGIPKCGF